MELNSKQAEQVSRLFENNPSLRSDMKIGWYSSGDAVISVYWDFDPKKELYNVDFPRI